MLATTSFILITKGVQNRNPRKECISKIYLGAKVFIKLNLQQFYTAQEKSISSDNISGNLNRLFEMETIWIFCVILSQLTSKCLKYKKCFNLSILSFFKQFAIFD